VNGSDAPRGRRSARAVAPIPTVTRSEGRVDFHFPVEIHIEESAGTPDVHEIAQLVFERLIKRLDEG
jgi:hypothetical protein